MAGQPVPTQRSSGTRVRLVLLLLVGLLGMHGLASQHATAGTADPTAMSMSVTGHMTMDHDSGATAREAERTASVVALPSPGPVWAAPSQPHSGMAMADLCLAVLTGALLLIRAATARAAAAPRTPCRAHRLLARISALPPPRPPDLVAGLCVSRT